MLEKLPVDIQTSILTYLGKEKSGIWQMRSVNTHFKKLSEEILLKDATNAILNVSINKYLEDSKKESNQESQSKELIQQKEKIEALASKIVTSNLIEVNELDLKYQDSCDEENEEKIYNEILKKLDLVENTFLIVYKANNQLSKKAKICPSLKGLSLKFMATDDSAWEFKFDNWIIEQCNFDAVFENCSWEDSALNHITFEDTATYRLSSLALAKEAIQLNFLTKVGYSEDAFGTEVEKLSPKIQSFMFEECLKVRNHFRAQVLTKEKENQQLREEVQRLRAKLEESAEKGEAAKVENDEELLQKRILEHAKSDEDDENNVDKKTCSSLSN